MPAIERACQRDEATDAIGRLKRPIKRCVVRRAGLPSITRRLLLLLTVAAVAAVDNDLTHGRDRNRAALTATPGRYGRLMLVHTGHTGDGRRRVPTRGGRTCSVAETGRRVRK